MDYWLHPFSGKTWGAFCAAGARLTAFREKHRNKAFAVQPGDRFLCYLLRVKRWVGALEITQSASVGQSPPFLDGPSPVRIAVNPLIVLPPEHGVPMESLEGALTFFQKGDKPSQWAATIRRSFTKFRSVDGQAILAALREAAAHPVNRPVDPKKLEPPPNLYKVRAGLGTRAVETVISIPSVADEEVRGDDSSQAQAPTHTEIQWRLLDVGARMDLEVWAPKSDRQRSWAGGRIAEIPTLLDRFPDQFNLSPAAMKTIENIDVLWLKGGSIIAAFEVEHSTSIYSGLLRMSDLVTINPRVSISLYLVAPDDRACKFTREIARPTFASGATPLHTICRFLPYSALCARLEEARSVTRYLKPEFLDEIAERYDPEEDLEE